MAARRPADTLGRVSQGARNAAFVVALAAVIAVLAYGLSRRTSGSRDLLSSAPRRAIVLAELDVPPLRRSSLFRELVGESDAGLDRIESTCGFDPLDQLRTLQIFVLRAEDEEEGEAGFDQVAFLARGALEHEQLARCVSQVVEGDGGGVHPTTLEGVDAIASDHGSSVAAFLGTDAVVAGDDTVVAELIRIQQGAADPHARDDSLMRLLRRAGPSSHVRLVALLPRHWQRFLGRLTDVVGDDVPLDRARALGLGASLDDGLAISLTLDLGDAHMASDAQHALETRIAEARRDPDLAASVLAVTLAHVDVEAASTDLTVSASLDRPELDATIALARRYLAREASSPTE